MSLLRVEKVVPDIDLEPVLLENLEDFFVGTQRRPFHYQPPGLLERLRGALEDSQFSAFDIDLQEIYAPL